MEDNDVINKWINKDVLINVADFKYLGLKITNHINPLIKDEAQTALFKGPVRTAL